MNRWQLRPVPFKFQISDLTLFKISLPGELHVTYEGQKKHVLKPGSYAYGPAKIPHQGRCVSARPCILFIAFEEPVDAIPVETAAR